MIRFLSRLTACLFYLAVGQVALAKPPLMGAIIGKQAFHGPGSRGFHATCSGEFNVGNFIQGSDIYTAGGSSWVTSASAGLTPTVNGTPVTGPDGAASAYQVTFPTTSGASHFSVITQTPSPGSLGIYPLAYEVWAQTTSSAANGAAYVSLSVSTNFVTTKIPTDGAWHLVQVLAPTFKFTPSTANPVVQIGINLFDVTTPQVATTGAVVVNLSYGFLVRRPSDLLLSMADIAGPLATTTAAVNANITKPCPPGVAMRDFRESLPATGLAPVTNNPIIPANSSEVYQAGGLSNPYITGTPLYTQGYYWGFTNSTTSLDHGAWSSYSLYKSRDGINWTEVTTNAPYMQVFGSKLANPTVNAGGTGYGTSVTGNMTFTTAGCPVPVVVSATTNGSGVITGATYVSGSCTPSNWPTTTGWVTSAPLSAGTGATFTWATVRGTGTVSAWQLHPAWLPYGCTISSVHHPFCILTGGATSGLSYATYMAWSDTVDGVYTPVGCTGPGTCSSPTAVIAAACSTSTCPAVAPSGAINNQNLPSIVNVGGPTGTNYVFTINTAVGNVQMQIWSMAGVPTGTALTWNNQAQLVPIGGTWDASATYIDPQVFLNKCGFYEMLWTAFKVAGFGGSPNKEQVIGYAVAASPGGPWFKYAPGPVIPVSSSLYSGTVFLGDSSPIVINGRFIWTGNFDNASNLSPGMAAVMQDACSY